jgi:DNA anti-recombination protein RmuC
METNEEKEGSAERFFKNFGKRMDEFTKELHESGGRLQKEFEKRFEELKESAEKFRKEAENKERWKEVEASLKKAGEELNKAVKTAFGKKAPEEN